MANIRFTRSRVVTNISANGGTNTTDYTLTSGKELSIIELFASTNTSLQKVEILYSEDNGTTWSNPFDEDSNHILQIWIGAGVPAAGKPEAAWFCGGANTILRVQITNLHPTQASEVYFLVKGWERNV